MKKPLCLLLAFAMLLALCACGSTAGDEEWTRQGYFQDENGNMLSVTWMDDVDEPGWYVGCMLGEDMYGNMLPQEGDTLHGNIVPDYEEGELIVTVSEEGDDGLLLTVEGGETYHFTPMDMPEASIIVTINVEGWGNIDYARGETAPEIDPEYPYQFAQINLAEPATHTFVAWPVAGNLFVKWTKNGKDFSTEPQITVLLDESADYVAVFEEDPDHKNPLIDFIGDYQCDRAHAYVESIGADSVRITIDWGVSAWEVANWVITGPLDAATMTVDYSGCSKTVFTYNDGGQLVSEEVVYEDGSGTVVFNDDGTFTWHEDQSESGTDMVFEMLPPA
ncbi:MAG: hypothetical protein IJH45_04505 [Firmicutes bacterium]|nr:hypothetical protein [Bacillota bacterium]